MGIATKPYVYVLKFSNYYDVFVWFSLIVGRNAAIMLMQQKTIVLQGREGLLQWLDDLDFEFFVHLTVAKEPTCAPLYSAPLSTTPKLW
jgi:hypothetical protein